MLILVSQSESEIKSISLKLHLKGPDKYLNGIWRLKQNGTEWFYKQDMSSHYLRWTETENIGTKSTGTWSVFKVLGDGKEDKKFRLGSDDVIFTCPHEVENWGEKKNGVDFNIKIAPCCTSFEVYTKSMLERMKCEEKIELGMRKGRKNDCEKEPEVYSTKYPTKPTVKPPMTKPNGSNDGKWTLPLVTDPDVTGYDPWETEPAVTEPAMTKPDIDHPKDVKNKFMATKMIWNDRPVFQQQLCNEEAEMCITLAPLVFWYKADKGSNVGQWVLSHDVGDDENAIMMSDINDYKCIDSCTSWTAGSGLKDTQVDFLDVNEMDSVMLFCKDKQMYGDGKDKGDKNNGDDDEGDNTGDDTEGQGDKGKLILHIMIFFCHPYINSS